ncbi:hypothetical protein ACFC1R_08515 [Kitasatospora sp. NPDC056138]|uniref:hypothetical protein n=1 Tax=Kitasatospora sp. NPDC056138 TaxID=3345724 RepID=UPI0035E1AA85
MRIGITGHRGLTGDVEQKVRELLESTLRDYAMQDLTVVSCIADGPDSWIATAALEHGARLEVVIPAQKYRENLPAWHHSEYDDLLLHAAEVHHTGMVESDGSAHMAGSEVLVGLVDELVAVWDGQVARGYGGTADVVAYAERIGVPVRVLWPQGATRD